MKTNILISVEKNAFLIGSFNVNSNIIIPDAVLNIELSKSKNTMNRVSFLDGNIDDNSDAFFFYDKKWFIISSTDYKTLAECDTTTIIEMLKFINRQELKTA